MKYVQCKRTVNYLIVRRENCENITFHFEMRSSFIIYLQMYSSRNVTYLLCVLNDKHSWKCKTFIKAIPPPILVWSLWDFLKSLSGLVLNFKWRGFHCILGEIHHLIDFTVRKCFVHSDLYGYCRHSLYTTLIFFLYSSFSLPPLLYLYLFQGDLFFV